ncbi:hypothetical protein [Mycobacterium simulans]|nr:hypothetical protein [Mycobacterium simulans]
MYVVHSAKLGDLGKKETELIAAKKRSLERSLFGLSSVTSSDPGQIIAYRDAQVRAAKLTGDQAEAVFASAMRSDDKALAAAVLGKALENGWSNIIDQYVKQNPSASEQLKDLAKLRDYDAFGATLSYATMAPSLRGGW